MHLKRKLGFYFSKLIFSYPSLTNLFILIQVHLVGMAQTTVQDMEAMDQLAMAHPMAVVMEMDMGPVHTVLNIAHTAGLPINFVIIPVLLALGHQAHMGAMAALDPPMGNSIALMALVVMAVALAL